MKAQRYRILGLDVVLSSDCGTFLEMFHMDHAFFAVPEPLGDRCLSVDYRNDSREGAALAMDGVTRSLAGSSTPEHHAYQMMLNGIMKAVHGFVILHGGVVAGSDGRALAVCGPSGTGKTTLVTALLDAGFQFLSDDYCPIHEGTRRVHPYPRTMWRVRNDGEPKARESGLRGHAPARMHPGKAPVPLDFRKVRIASEPCELGSLVTLDPGEAEDPWCIIRLHLEKRGEERLLKAASNIEGILVERIDAEAPVWAIRYRKRTGNVRKAASLLETVGTHAFSIARNHSRSPEFTKEPVLTRISSHETAHFLLEELKREPEGLRVKPGRYFAKLVELLSAVPCWRLTTGNLDRMRDLAASTL